MRLTSVVATNSTDGVTHIGFIKTTSAARSTDGAYFFITGDAIEAVCASNSVETVHTLPNLTNKAWYTLEIVCNEDGSITLTVYTEAGFIADAPQFGTFEEAGDAHEFCASLENDVFHVGYTQAETVPQPEWVV